MGVQISNRTSALEQTTAKGGLKCIKYQLFPLHWWSTKIFQLAWRLLAAKTTVTSHKVRKGGKDRESIQSSITPDPGYHLGKWQKHNKTRAKRSVPGRVAQSVTCLATDACLTADPGPVPYFRGDWSWNDFYGHSPPFRWFIQEGLLSVTSESMCTNYWLTACSSLPRKKCG